MVPEGRVVVLVGKAPEVRLLAPRTISRRDQMRGCNTVTAAARVHGNVTSALILMYACACPSVGNYMMAVIGTAGFASLILLSVPQKKYGSRSFTFIHSFYPFLLFIFVPLF
ncbi:hypothetical protein, unlikely [Trypanosoma brucei gambiense DAL972]|uniref:Uncharacterized protein n=1 Tax=Trypanosoma brucei gambiense (strain MHOM/CI/86/DAL972) TaxID=679716 RepID=D0AAK5_TRYB9|nr:hypothetical protein, unlikely [Trypanosoma brucei gambiense DAL972]CBH18706.1 hypothetical protein, unlikely [Trypanosoma brucei gambiense DAL972]|eukprot:XP_011780970.1 hypothetical protein, unlikely [Trypanosoma brucei gambiense DAL972]